ncbi:uncharacterized protein BT62DRAFT_52000 [Guyanagaster necrorhizus]|uniref:Uncharacterized protein n=1 Tax=Guyanagaster necrorhizus TaxID=856835 RepID=A0A9P8AZF1_9AGAR|nr:uncharacterized protein BT62DRAFT_52000 [Guyanagaster necrorhizus MCA 3950]KAG7453216.1 hypothetical protein BT62DRAFT_52000 [Guyanagaster necrorhizus MCA 3950]
MKVLPFFFLHFNSLPFLQMAALRHHLELFVLILWESPIRTRSSAEGRYTTAPLFFSERSDICFTSSRIAVSIASLMSLHLESNSPRTPWMWALRSWTLIISGRAARRLRRWCALEGIVSGEEDAIPRLGTGYWGNESIFDTIDIYYSVVTHRVEV